ncbi:hypothetical protein D3C84_1048880 [compost metagenome]
MKRSFAWLQYVCAGGIQREERPAVLHNNTGITRDVSGPEIEIETLDKRNRIPVLIYNSRIGRVLTDRRGVMLTHLKWIGLNLLPELLCIRF